VRFLADMGVAGSTIQALRIRGDDPIHLREEGLGRLPDTAILEKARREGRIVLTFDLEFGDLLAAALYDRPSVIIFRLRNQTPASVTPRLLKVLTERSQELEQGVVVIVEEARYRVRRLPIAAREESP
jgi:predicted nuclease of predicted toxin-antitoxin system